MKKLKFILISLIIVAVLFVSYHVYLFYTPDIEIRIGQPEDKTNERYLEQITLTFAERSPFLMPKEKYDQIKEFILAYDEVFEEYYFFEPYAHIEVDVELKDGETILTFFGDYSDENGEIKEYHRQIILDFILTDKITYSEIRTMEPSEEFPSMQ